VGAYVLRRLAWAVPTLLGITLLTFLAVHLVPGDPAQRAVEVEAQAGGASSDEQRTLFRAEHLLDAPLWRQYLHFVGPFDLSPQGARAFGGSGAHPWHGLLAGDLGGEFQRPGVAVLPEIGARLAVTAPFALAAVLLVYLLGVPLGVLGALRAGGAADRASRAVLLALHALPAFWLGLLLILAFGATGLAWLPVLGLRAQDGRAGSAALDLARHAVLPLATLTLPGLAYVARQTRAALLEVLDQEFVRAARARGLRERDVLVRHALRNALLPLVSLLSTLLPALLGGSVIVETLFGLPGLGRYAYEGMLARDLAVILGVTTVSAALTLLSILLADLAYAALDPRVRHG
jgi:peptide/nickel transport system permease protein